MEAPRFARVGSWVTWTRAPPFATVGTEGGCDTRTHDVCGIFVQAVRGDVDAGIGNRWLDVASPNLDAFEPTPVTQRGILGIGAEVGGDVTVIAGRDVLTGN